MVTPKYTALLNQKTNDTPAAMGHNQSIQNKFHPSIDQAISLTPTKLSNAVTGINTSAPESIVITALGYGGIVLSFAVDARLNQVHVTTDTITNASPPRQPNSCSAAESTIKTPPNTAIPIPIDRRGVIFSSFRAIPMTADTNGSVVDNTAALTGFEYFTPRVSMTVEMPTPIPPISTALRQGHVLHK